jgi:mycoredoxin
MGSYDPRAIPKGRCLCWINGGSSVTLTFMISINSRENEILFGVLRRVDPEAALRAPTGSAPVSAELPKGGIVMYCTSWCPGCRRARAWFQARNLPFKEVDIDTNPAAVAQVKKWNNGNRTTPTFDIDGTILSVFNEQKMLEALQEKGLIR